MAGFFVAEEMGEGKLAPQGLPHVRHGTKAHLQRQPPSGQIALKLGHAIERKAEVARAALAALRPLQLDHHQAERALKKFIASDKGA